MTKLPAQGTEDISGHSLAGCSLLRRRVARLLLLIEQGAPDIIIRKERRLVDDAHSALGTQVIAQDLSSDTDHLAKWTCSDTLCDAPITRDAALLAFLAGAEEQFDLKQHSLLH